MNPTRLLLASSLLLTTPVMASGLFLAEGSYANLGAAGAGDGVYNGSAAAIWINPAVMSSFNTDLTTVNLTAFDLSVRYLDATDPTRNSGQAGKTLPTGGFFHVKQLNQDWHLGLALGSLGGAEVDYGTQWAGSRQLTHASIFSLQFNPSLSYAINPQWSIAAGLQVNYAEYEGGLNPLPNIPAVSGQLKQADSWAYGFNLGTFYQASEQLKLGLSYRSKLTHSFDGYTQSGRSYSTDVLAAAQVDLSASYQLNPRLTLLGSIQWHQWSEFDETVIDVGDNLNANRPTRVVLTRDWRDVWHYAAGFDYQLEQGWRLKMGASYETSPLNDASKQKPDLPADRQIRYSAGLSKQINGYEVSVYYQYADMGKTDIVQTGQFGLNGHFNVKVHYLGLGVTF
ncbi:OmpP1/FadL family transporter [Motilimonas eburnea]|uniref:OmpP1/FadL family transporter n=1 Tax=Motilimonas eburnea TaxID=1737488 RepID=UPI001E6031FB|nr:outer membrane protein transport protein [Motilimonas eburnea]MCE2573465.1 outer membrane protein transport protein [Motilimonas eburnea]